LRNEIRSLKESLKLKSAQITMAEHLASSQLKESLTTIQQLTEISNIQVCNHLSLFINLSSLF